MKKWIASLAIALLSTSIFAETSKYIGVEDLGSTKLSWLGDRDTVVVNNCVRGFSVKSVKIKVTRNNARIDSIFLYFRNGDIEELPLKTHFSVGDESRWINLGGRRCIQSFEVYGDTEGIPIKKTRVRMYGKAYVP